MSEAIIWSRGAYAWLQESNLFDEKTLVKILRVYRGGGVLVLDVSTGHERQSHTNKLVPTLPEERPAP